MIFPLDLWETMLLIVFRLGFAILENLSRHRLSACEIVVVLVVVMYVFFLGGGMVYECVCGGGGELKPYSDY